jgi:protein-glutamine gamma-glutamyltransferase
MKTPPFLLFAALLFWGWQTDFLWIGVALGMILELPRLVKFRWELDDSDFNRIFSFCVVLNAVLIGYVFTHNETIALENSQHGNAALIASEASAQATTRFLCWLPMTFFPFMVVQVFNVRESVPLTAVSIVLRWRRRRGDRAFADIFLNFSFPYFLICIFSASIHAAGTLPKYYFEGLFILAAWALWSVRPARYKIFVWLTALAAIALLGVAGIFGIHRAQAGLQSLNAALIQKFFHADTDPLRATTSMGQIGDLKLSAKIVIRLQPREIGHVPEYLREASYRNYFALKREWLNIGGVRDFEPLSSGTNGATWTLLPGKKNSDAVNIACYLDSRTPEGDPAGLLPLPSGCGRLENLPVFALKMNRTGSAFASGLGLVIFDAHYGPGATFDAPPDLDSTNQYDLAVPTNEISAVQKVITEMNLPTNLGEDEKLRAVEKFFLGKFTYSTWQGKDKQADTNGTPLTKFLTTSRNGHCEYFASATVLLLRELKIPARYAVGYYVHEPHGAGYIVRERDAHAWCLVWRAEKNCWEDFDTTPPSWVGIESARSHWDEWLDDVTSWLRFEFAKFRWRQANLQQYIFWSLIPVLLVLLWHIIFRRRGKLHAEIEKNIAVEKNTWPGLDSEFFQLEKKLASRGVPRRSGENFSDWLERALSEKTLADFRAPLRELLRLHYQYRFDPEGLSAAQREELRTKTISAIERISAMAAK